MGSGGRDASTVLSLCMEWAFAVQAPGKKTFLPFRWSRYGAMLVLLLWYLPKNLVFTSLTIIIMIPGWTVFLEGCIRSPMSLDEVLGMDALLVANLWVRNVVVLVLGSAWQQVWQLSLPPRKVSNRSQRLLPVTLEPQWPPMVLVLPTLIS